jgi:hypothetical protein
MPVLSIQQPAVSPAAGLNAAWNHLRSRLEREKAGIYQAIGSYPPPIAACDQQFSYLLEERSRISAELARLNEAEAASLAVPDPGQLLDDFIRSSPYIDAETAQTSRAALGGC